MPEIRHYLTIQAPVDKVFRAISTQDGLRGWWTDGATAEPKEGTHAEFRFGDRYHNKMLVRRLDSPKRVEWECLMGDEEWMGTTFVFELEPHAEGTAVRFEHGKWRKMTDFFASCNYNWGYYMRSLKLFCETGQGTPFDSSEK